MADFNFPSDPQIGDTYTIDSRTWFWNGYAWQLQTSIAGLDPFTAQSIVVTTSTNSTSTNSGALIVAGGIGVNSSIYVGADVLVDGSIAFGQALSSSYTAPAILAGTPVNLDNFDVTKYRTGKYLVQIVDSGYTPNRFHCAELLVSHDNNGDDTQGYIVQYGIVANTGELGVWDATYTTATTSLNLLFTPFDTSPDILVRVVRTVLEV